MSLVGFKAKNHPQQEVKDWVDDRRTPQELFQRLQFEHGFTVDAAASPTNALLDKYWTREQNALSQSWTNERVWVNPPYSSLKLWVDKAEKSMREGCKLVVMLLPANRCEQKWWQEYIEPFRDGKAEVSFTVTTQFLPGRLRFEWPKERVVPDKGDRPPFGCVIVTWKNRICGRNPSGDGTGGELSTSYKFGSSPDCRSNDAIQRKL
jgi:phage N-6-adenine-methyltransferase